MDDVVSDANVFARPLNKVDPGGKAAKDMFDDGCCGSEVVGEIGVDESELYDGDLDVMGTMRLFSFPSDILLCESFFASGCVRSSTGISSGAGTGSPLAAAANWFSVHESE